MAGGRGSARLTRTEVRASCIGIDLAWSPNNPTGLAVATVTEAEVNVLATATVKTNAEIIEFIRPHVAAPLTIAIDAPTIVVNETGMRECERILQQDKFLQRAHSTPYPGNRKRLGACNGGVPRGEELVKLLASEFDVREVGCPPPRHSGRFAMEVFPAPARARLFNLTTPLPYKKKKKRSWEQCRAGLNSYIERLRALENPFLDFPVTVKVTDEKASALKKIEDKVDAIMCAYVAALASLGKADCVGSLADGYIVLPAVREIESV